MDLPRVVIDTNVWGSAFRSRRGASWELVSEMGSGHFEPQVSASLVLEHEEVFHHERRTMNLSEAEIEELIDLICELGTKQRKIFFRWPYPADPDDAHVFELAVAAQADYLITFNKRDFPRAAAFDICLATPYEFLTDIGLLH